MPNQRYFLFKEGSYFMNYRSLHRFIWKPLYFFFDTGLYIVQRWKSDVTLFENFLMYSSSVCIFLNFLELVYLEDFFFYIFFFKYSWSYFHYFKRPALRGPMQNQPYLVQIFLRLLLFAQNFLVSVSCSYYYLIESQ